VTGFEGVAGFDGGGGVVTSTRTTARDVAAEIAYLTQALKAPSLRESAGRLVDRARAESWSHEEYLAACLQREVAARDAHGGESRIRAAPSGLHCLLTLSSESLTT
jgi:DNA replication protein DnaC